MLYTPLNDQVFLQVLPPRPDSLQMPQGTTFTRVLALAPGADCSGMKKDDIVVVRSSADFGQYIVTSYRDCLLRVKENSDGNAQ